jgi:hypothetical protein
MNNSGTFIHRRACQARLDADADQPQLFHGRVQAGQDFIDRLVEVDAGQAEHAVVGALGQLAQVLVLDVHGHRTVHRVAAVHQAQPHADGVHLVQQRGEGAVFRGGSRFGRDAVGARHVVPQQAVHVADHVGREEGAIRAGGRTQAEIDDLAGEACLAFLGSGHGGLRWVVGGWTIHD